MHTSIYPHPSRCPSVAAGSVLLALVLAVLLFSAGQARAEDMVPAPAAAQASPAYRLATDDTVRIAVFDEPDLHVEQRIDEQGQVRLALHGPLTITGLSVREAEKRIEAAYVEARLLRHPQVTVTITAFRPRGALALGQLKSTGNISFPPNTESIDIVQFVTLAGGFTETARTGNVSVVRQMPDGTERSFTVDVGSMLERKPAPGERPEGFLIQPGDRVIVDQRIF